jgi:hypothetical protein
MTPISFPTRSHGRDGVAGGLSGEGMPPKRSGVR